MKGLIDDLKDCSDCIMGIRDEIGVGLKKVALVTRTWTGGEIGAGTAHEEIVPLKFTPHIVDLSLNFRALEGGQVKYGDLLLKGISKHQNPDKTVFETVRRTKAEERFIQVGDAIYITIAIRERYLQWDIQVRPASDQRRYRSA